MSDAFSDAEPCADDTFPEGALIRAIKIVNRKGLHARASAKFVQCAERFQSAICVHRCGETAGGTSIMALLTLAAAQGTTITVSAVGADAEQALNAIDELVSNRFGEDE